MQRTMFQKIWPICTTTSYYYLLLLLRTMFQKIWPIWGSVSEAVSTSCG